MKRLLAILLTLALMLGLSAAVAEEGAPALQKNLVILFTSDVHCGMDQGWGYAGLYAIKQSLSEDNYVLLVDDGDSIQGEPVGTITQGEAIIDIMDTVGYDIAIPGNHEFDYGMERFLELADKANYPYISCNFNKEGELIFEPYVIKEFDGVKIAFVGVTTPLTPRSSTPRYFMDDEGNTIYGFMMDADGQAVYDAIQGAVDSARADGASYVFLISHLGDEAECEPWTYADVISHTSGIDAVMDGHSHDSETVVMQNKDGEDVIRCGVGTKLEGIGSLTLTPDGTLTPYLYVWHEKTPAPTLLGLDNAGNQAVAEAATVLSDMLQTVVATTPFELYIYDPTAVDDKGKPVRIVRRTETNLGDLCADAYRDQGQADIALVNGGGIRANIKAGEITYNDILTVHPFGNSLTVIEVTGQQILDALEWSVHSLPGEFGGFDHVSGLTFEFDPTIPSPCLQDENAFFAGVDETLERRVRSVLVAGEPIDPEKTYTLASHDYQLLSHGDGYTMYDGAPVLQESVKIDNQVLIDYITQTLGGVIGEEYENPYGQGRIVALNAEE